MNDEPTGKLDAVELMGPYLRQNPPHIDGTPGSYYLRLGIIEKACMVATKRGIGLGTNDRRDAAERALIVARAFRAAGVMFSDKRLYFIAGNPCPSLGEVEELARQGKRKRYVNGKAVEPQEGAQGAIAPFPRQVPTPQLKSPPRST